MSDCHTFFYGNPQQIFKNQIFITFMSVYFDTFFL